MENRERDRLSKRTTPTEAGQINRQVEEEKGREHHSGTTAEFGQNIGESEFPSDKGGNMKRNKDDMTNSNMGNESSRRSGSGSFGSSSGRSGSSGEMGSNSSSKIGSNTNRRGSTGELGSTGNSEGRH